MSETLKCKKVKNERRKYLRCIFKPTFIDNKTELHLLSLGKGGGVTEKTDGDFFSVRVNSDCKIDIRTADTVYGDDICEEGHLSLLNELRTTMFMNICKLKKKYGSFEFDGELIFAPCHFYDEDDTVTVTATKYHRVRMGHLGTVVIRNFKPSFKLTDIDIDDATKMLQLYFNIHSHTAYKCYINDEMIPTEETDTVVEIPTDYKLEDIPNLLDKLAENTKSLINDRLDVKGCEVEGYVFYVKGIPYIIINKRWEELKEKYLEKYNSIAEWYGCHLKSEKILTYDDVNTWVMKCEDFLNDATIPRGVRFTKKDTIIKMLSKLCSNSITVGDYLRFTNRLLIALE